MREWLFDRGIPNCKATGSGQNALVVAFGRGRTNAKSLFVGYPERKMVYGLHLRRRLSRAGAWMFMAISISLWGGGCADGEDACGLSDDEIVFDVVIVDDDRAGLIRVHMELREQGGGPGLALCERRGERLLVNGSAAKSRLVQGNYAYELTYRALPETGFVIVLDRDSGRESRVLELPKLAAPELLSPEPDQEFSSDGMLALTWVPANDPNVMSLQLTLRDDFGTQCLSAPLSIELADSGVYSINPASLTLTNEANAKLENAFCPVELELERTRELPSMPGLAMEGSVQLIARRTVSLRLR